MSNEPLVDEFKKQFSQLLHQSLAKIEHCLSQLDKDQIWFRPAASMNSIGNLLLHITGNLEQWASVPLSNAIDKRDRDAEFSSDQKIDSRELLKRTQSAVERATAAVGSLDEASKLLKRVNIQGFNVSQMEALLHTACHFQGHTHQIIQLTRLILKDNYRFHWNPEMSRDHLPM